LGKRIKVGLKTYVDLETGGTKCTDVWMMLGDILQQKSLGYPNKNPNLY
jgi:hypothetical protein